MSRFYVTLQQGSRTDPEAIIGYDRPMGTYFLQGFPVDKGEYEDFEIWLGLDFGACKTLDILFDAADRLGFKILDLKEEQRLAMEEEAATPYEGVVWAALLQAANSNDPL